MSFYLKPPRGETNLHILFECVQQRLNCYSNLQRGTTINDPEKFEYLLEDSILDRTGHFVFRLGVLTGSIPRNVFLENEVELLKQRLKCHDKDDLECFLRNIIRQLKSCIRTNTGKILSDFYWTLYTVVSMMLQKEFLIHIFRNHTADHTDEDSCDIRYSIQVPFYYCHKLIAARKVDLRKGKAVFECYHWKEILPTLLVSFLKIVLHEMTNSINAVSTMSDDRIIGCLRILRSHYLKHDEPNTGGIQLKDIQEESIYFPLCMRNLYNSLKLNHRLAHNDRFDLSLFMKNIGLSMNDSIKFWQGEYVQQHSSCSKCSHSWQDNEKKYIYGIRHLYGLEGSRRKYSVRSCHHLQGSGIGINSEGGCPFVHYDDDFLRNALKKNLQNSDDDIEVMIFERREDPSISCKLFSDCVLRRLNRDVLPENVKFENPVHYFNRIKGKKTDLA